MTRKAILTAFLKTNFFESKKHEEIAKILVFLYTLYTILFIKKHLFVKKYKILNFPLQAVVPRGNRSAGSTDSA